MSVVYNLGKSIFMVYFTISGEWAGCLRENNCSVPLCVRRVGDTRRTSEMRALARADTHIHIVEFILIAEIATIHSLVIYSEERSSAPHPARTRGEKGSGGAEIESTSTSKTNIVSHETDCRPS